MEDTGNTILIVEDEDKISRLLEIELEMEGYTVARADNGLDGFELFRNGGWDLVLLDIMLPGISGIELLRRIRQQDADIPVLLMSAKSAVEDKVSGLDLGANDYITKPFQIEELLARIRVALRLSKKDKPAGTASPGYAGMGNVVASASVNGTGAGNVGTNNAGVDNAGAGDAGLHNGGRGIAVSAQQQAAGAQNDAVPIAPKLEREQRAAAVHGGAREEAPEEAGAWFVVADLKLNELTRAVSRGGRAIELTPREFDLLVYLLRNPRIVLDREQILTAVWGYDYFGETNIVDVYIRYLRKKIDAGQSTALIHTVRGVGYVLRDNL